MTPVLKSYFFGGGPVTANVGEKTKVGQRKGASSGLVWSEKQGQRNADLIRLLWKSEDIGTQHQPDWPGKRVTAK
jgi:hypothetical protein